MDNHFHIIGHIIRDLRQNVTFDPFDSNFDFLTDEFSEMTRGIAATWINSPSNISYFLEFHQAEGERLLAMVRAEQDNYKGIAIATEQLKFISRVYNTLESSLIEFLDRLKLMMTIDPYAKTPNWNVN